MYTYRTMGHLSDLERTHSVWPRCIRTSERQPLILKVIISGGPNVESFSPFGLTSVRFPPVKSTSQSAAAASTTLISFPLAAALFDRLLIRPSYGRGAGITDSPGLTGAFSLGNRFINTSSVTLLLCPGAFSSFRTLSVCSIEGLLVKIQP